MRAIFRLIIVGLLSIALHACSKSDPGPLSGTWRLSGVVPMTIQFRKGESEAMGIIEKVSYEVKGNQVIVTTESGPMKGVAVRYIIKTPNTVTTQIGTLRRIK